MEMKSALNLNNVDNIHNRELVIIEYSDVLRLWHVYKITAQACKPYRQANNIINLPFSGTGW